jgi:AcrR family transcriptional regulator
MEREMSHTEAADGGRVERKKGETKQKIIGVAMKLFREQGIHATTMEQIAEEVDIAKGTLYNYFPVKEAILSEYIQRAFRERNADRIQRLLKLPDTPSRLALALGELIEGVQAYPAIFESYHVYRVKNMISLRQDESVETGIGLLSAEIIQLGQRSGEIRRDLPLDLLLDLFEFVFIEVAMQFYKNSASFNARQAIEQGVDLFMNGVKPKGA